MTCKQFNVCCKEVENYTDRDAYISDLALSSIWGDGPDDPIPKHRLEKLESIYDAVHRSVKDIATASGLSQRKLAEGFCIPARTVEDWCAGKRTPPDYVRLMMQECLGLLQR